MAKLVYRLNQSLDGYVDHTRFDGPPSATLFRHFMEQVRDASGLLYGRRLYEDMRYWDQDLPDWDAEKREYAKAWQSQPKWVVSRTLKTVGPNATLVSEDVVEVVRKLRAELPGEIGVGGADLAQSLGDAGLIDAYQIYLHPVVLGHGKPFFSGSPPPLRFEASDLIDGKVIRLTYVPA